jgi:hypothetical protein
MVGVRGGGGGGGGEREREDGAGGNEEESVYSSNPSGVSGDFSGNNIIVL